MISHKVSRQPKVDQLEFCCSLCKQSFGQTVGSACRRFMVVELVWRAGVASSQSQVLCCVGQMSAFVYIKSFTNYRFAQTLHMSPFILGQLRSALQDSNKGQSKYQMAILLTARFDNSVFLKKSASICSMFLKNTSKFQAQILFLLPFKIMPVTHLHSVHGS